MAAVAAALTGVRPCTCCPRRDEQRANRVQRFFQLSCATGVFVAVEMGVIAGLELNRYIDRLTQVGIGTHSDTFRCRWLFQGGLSLCVATQFTLEIFEVFVCSVLIYVAGAWTN